MTETSVFCERCGARCSVAVKRNPNAKMLRYSKEPKGLCVNCATQDWLRNTYPVNMQLAESGPGILVYPHIRKVFADIMRTAGADANPDEINWNLVNENWELPFAHKIKPSATNPCTQEQLDEIKAEKYKAIDTPEPLSEKAKLLLDNGLVIKSFEQLNLFEEGLGDELKKCLDQTKEKTMAKNKARKTAKGEQIPLIDVGPENLDSIVKEVRIYKKHQADRLAALKKETSQKEKIKALVKDAELQRLKDGKIRFEADNAIVCVTPQDDLITIKEKTSKKAKKSMKKTVKTEETKFENETSGGK